ncbi:structure-specific endonuclease subunit SLX4 [Phlebotomus argentipes]|uniref:structure-specific endonuclease subunit SLX4 n=1 Tax=Phlebotomus argentipes TaxID=94469 RepID=UPI002892BEC0|nr:structure-specific endonuclease subunit SLX4 [Phlebotomus argentipes]
MDKKRDKFARLRSKNCSKIGSNNAGTTQITKFFNPKISSSVSGTIASEVLSQQSQKSGHNDAGNVTDNFIDLDEESSKDSVSGSQSRPRREKAEQSGKRMKKRGSCVERRGPKSKTRKVSDEKFLNKFLVKKSIAENINPDDLQLALALSRSITESHEECLTVQMEDDDSSTSHSSKSTAKFTLEEYGFKSSTQYNTKMRNFLGMEELKGFRKMSPLLHRNPKKQNRLFDEKINELLSKSIWDEEDTRKERLPYNFLVTTENHLKWTNHGDGIMSLNSNSELSSNVYSCYYKGNLVKPSYTMITALLRNWDEIPGREMSPSRTRNIKVVENEAEIEGSIEFEQFDRSVRSETPDILLSDEDNAMESSQRESMSIEILSDEKEIPETPEELMKSRTIGEEQQEDHEVKSLSFGRTESKSFLEMDDKIIDEDVIVIESDEEDKINQSINKIIEDQETKHLGKKSVSDGFLLCQNRSQLADEFDHESFLKESSPISSQININSLLSGDIIEEEPVKVSQGNEKEVTFVSQSLKNQDICVVKRRAVTPPPDFDSFDEEEIQKQLKKYGLKAIKGQKAKTLLEHIYNQLHPFIQVEDEMFQLKCKYGLIDAEPEQTKVGESGALPEHMDILCKDDFLGNVEAEKCILSCPPRKKLPTCAVPLHIAFYNFLQCNKEIHEQILQYQPIPLETIQGHFRDMGMRFEANDLIEFLDKTCVTFQGPNSGSRTCRKALPRKSNTKEKKSSDECGE